LPDIEVLASVEAVPDWPELGVVWLPLLDGLLELEGD